MTEQLHLDIHPAPLQPGIGATIDDRFHDFHQRNAWVYTALETMTAELVAAGQRRVGMKMLVEVLRWRYFRQTFDRSSPFRLNNSYTSRYARLLVQNHPEWHGVFETRRLHTASAA